MERFYIPGTKTTPEVLFDPAEGRLAITGQSYPENAFKFYEPLLAWVDGYLAGMSRETLVAIELQLPYINTSSTKCFMLLLEKLDDAHRAGKQVRIRWYYDADNESELECAEEFKEDLELPFELVPKADGR